MSNISKGVAGESKSIPIHQPYTDATKTETLRAEQIPASQVTMLSDDKIMKLQSKKINVNNVNSININKQSKPMSYNKPTSLSDNNSFAMAATNADSPPTQY